MDKQLLVEDRFSRRDQLFAQAAFSYSDARCVLGWALEQRRCDTWLARGSAAPIYEVGTKEGTTGSLTFLCPS